MLDLPLCVFLAWWKCNRSFVTNSSYCCYEWKHVAVSIFATKRAPLAFKLPIFTFILHFLLFRWAIFAKLISFHKYTIKSSQYLINVSVVGNEKVETQVQFYVLIVSKQAPKTVLRTVNILTILTSSATGIIPTVVFIS